MAKKKHKSTASGSSIPAGVYPELDRDLGLDNAENDIAAVNLGLWPNAASTPFPAGPAFGTDLARDNMENDITAADLEDQRQDPRFR